MRGASAERKRNTFAFSILQPDQNSALRRATFSAATKELREHYGRMMRALELAEGPRARQPEMRFDRRPGCPIHSPC